MGSGSESSSSGSDTMAGVSEAMSGQRYNRKSTTVTYKPSYSASGRDPDFGASASKPSPKMGRSPAAFQAMLGSTGQGAKDAAALAGRSEFGSASNFNALGKMVTEARGDTKIVIPSVTTAGGAIAKRKMNEAMLQKIIAGGKPVFKDGNIVGVDEDGTYTGQPKMDTTQDTRDEPSQPKIEDEPDEVEPVVAGVGRSTKARRGTGRRGVAFGSRRSLVNLRSLGKRGLG